VNSKEAAAGPSFVAYAAMAIDLMIGRCTRCKIGLVPSHMTFGAFESSSLRAVQEAAERTRLYVSGKLACT
jgi:hypothetical protein